MLSGKERVPADDETTTANGNRQTEGAGRDLPPSCNRLEVTWTADLIYYEVR